MQSAFTSCFRVSNRDVDFFLSIFSRFDAKIQISNSSYQSFPSTPSTFLCCAYAILLILVNNVSSLSPTQIHGMHQSLRDLRFDQQKLSDDLDREILLRNRYQRRVSASRT